jgi:hypothetical protein
MIENNVVQIIPSTELTGLETTIGQVEGLTAQVVALRDKARVMSCSNREEYSALLQVVADERILRKQGAAMFAPFTSIIDRAKSFVKTQAQKHDNACEELEAAAKPKLKDFERKELAETQKEQDELNKKREKRDLPPVEVKPALPTAAGYRRTTNYPIIIEDTVKFMRAAKKDKDLLKFIILDFQALAKEARDLKDPEAFNKKYPGVFCRKD